MMFTPMKVLRVLYKEPGKEAETRELEIKYTDKEDLDSKELKLLQDLVNGYIEIHPLVTSSNDRVVTVICNEEGRLRGFLHNVANFVGNIIILAECATPPSEDDDGVEFVSLNDEELRKAHAWCKKYSVTTPETLEPSFKIMSDPEEIRQHYELLRQEGIRKQQEWENL